jgi:hypothetical protein
LLFTASNLPGKTPAEVRGKVKKAFQRNSQLVSEEDIKKAVTRGEFVLKEMEALIFLQKYRTMKNRYYNVDDAIKKLEDF